MNIFILGGKTYEDNFAKISKKSFLITSCKNGMINRRFTFKRIPASNELSHCYITYLYAIDSTLFKHNPFAVDKEEWMLAAIRDSCSILVSNL